MKPNWFIGYAVTAGDWYHDVIAHVPPGTRTFHPDDLHLTLAFLAGVDESAALEAWAVALDSHPPAVTATLSNVRPFGHPKRPSAFSLTIDQGNDALCDALTQQGTLIRAKVGLGPEKRGPHPHITVARPPRRADDAARNTLVAWSKTVLVPQVTLELNRLALYTWSKTYSQAASDPSVSQFRIVKEAAL